MTMSVYTGWATSASELMEAYGRCLDASPKTVDTYMHALGVFCRWLESRGIGPLDATRETVIDFKRHMAGEHAASTVNAYLTAIRSFYAWLASTGMAENVAAGVRGVRESAHSAKDCLTADQAAAVARGGALNDGEGEAALRDRAMLNLMVRRGLRTIEVSRADVGDVRFECGRSVLYVQGKGHADKDDFIVLGDECLGPIRDYLSARGHVRDDDPLFAATGNRNRGGRMTTRTISRIAKGAMESIGLDSPRLTAHSLRHTAVTLSLMGGASVQEAQAMARHASIGTTMIYAHNLDRLNAGAESAVDSLIDAADSGEHTGEHMANTHPTGETSSENTSRAHLAPVYVFGCEHATTRGNAAERHIGEHTANTPGREAARA
jgi:site-specific recombinase XerD